MEQYKQEFIEFMIDCNSEISLQNQEERPRFS